MCENFGFPWRIWGFQGKIWGFHGEFWVSKGKFCFLIKNLGKFGVSNDILGVSNQNFWKTWCFQSIFLEIVVSNRKFLKFGFAIEILGNLGFPSENLGFPRENLGFPIENLGFPKENLGFPIEFWEI